MHGKVATSTVGAIVKEGSDKCRPTHDLKRTIVNTKVRFTEKLVEPRPADAIEDIGDEEVTLIVLDFSDAFNEVKVDWSERQFIAVRAW